MDESLFNVAWAQGCNPFALTQPELGRPRRQGRWGKVKRWEGSQGEETQSRGKKSKSSEHTRNPVDETGG